MFKFVRYFWLFLIFLPLVAKAAEQIRIVGSSTIYPFITVASEQFSKKYNVPTPIVEATGSGGGFKLFCSKYSRNSPQITTSSRKIKKSEIQLCYKNNIKNIKEIILGFDGITIASFYKSKFNSFSSRDLFLALAAKLPKNGKLVDNYYQTWREVNPNLPKIPIEIYGPSATSGTRESFVDLIMLKECQKMKEFYNELGDNVKVANQCKMIREDGKFKEVGENDNIIIQKITINRKALGIVGFNFLEYNSKVKASKINDIVPSHKNISNLKYPISRPLYIYVNQDIATNDVNLLLKEIASPDAIGPSGYLTTKGLIN